MKTGIRFTWVAIAAALLLVTVACAPTAAPTPTPTKPPTEAPTKIREPIKLGYINSFSGYMAPMALPQRDVVLLLEEKINKEGGINGRPLKVILMDDESDETKAILGMKKLIEQDRVLAIVGTSSSGIAMAQAPIVEQAKVPWVATQSMRAPAVGRKWVFKLPVSERINIQAQYKFMRDRGAKKFALLTVAAGLGKEVVKYYDRTVGESGMTLVAREEYGPKDTDMKPQLTRIKAAGPDALVIYGAEAAAAIAVRQAKELGIDIPIIGPNAIALPRIMAVKELREGLEGVYLTGFKSSVWEQLPDTDPQKKVNAHLAEMIKAKYNRPLSDWEGVAYDGMMVMLNAIRAANPDPANVEEARAKIRDALETRTKNYVGALSLIDSYTPTEHEGSPNPDMMVVQTVRDGKIIVAK
jgi:branched-chain amino acid transport system substrate-binding protein